MTFADKLSITFLIAVAGSALIVVAGPLVPHLVTALSGHPVALASVGSALAAVAAMLAALLTSQR